MKIVELSGGVGGARMARGLATLEGVDLTVVVNVGDDSDNLGMVVCPDLDTVVYTLAGVEGAQGWGRRDDTFAFNEELARFGVDNTFRIGDRDLALKMYRTSEIAESVTLTKVTRSIVSSFELSTTVLPVTDDRLRTMVLTRSGWLTFQEYFVERRHEDQVLELRFEGSAGAKPAPGVIESIVRADLVVIGPSNPPLSIWPILAVPGVRDAIQTHPNVVAVSPLIGGKTLKGPADRVMRDLGRGEGNLAVASCYEGLIRMLVVDSSDAGGDIGGLEVLATDILITDLDAGARLAGELVRS
ncbi:MAG: 2-phospho-L-lactate transferase [Acidimicrobiia bacterium]